MLFYPFTSVHTDFGGNRIDPLIKITGDVALSAVHFFDM